MTRRPERSSKLRDMMYKISPSILEEFRLLQIGAYSKTVADFRNKVLGVFKINEAASRGKAYHEMIEHGPEKYRKGDRYEVHEPELKYTWVFQETAVRPIALVRDPAMIFETWADYTTRIAHHDVVMKMRLDGLRGKELHEFKTTKRTPHAYTNEETGYLDSLQHKCYLCAFPDLASVVYHIFQIDNNNRHCSYTTFEKVRDGNESAEVAFWLRSLLSWVQYHGDIEKALRYE